MIRFIVFVLIYLFAAPIFATEDAKSFLPIPIGTGKAKGLMGVIMVPTVPLSKTLPRGLKLAPELMQKDGTYPSAMFVGENEDLSVIAGGKSILVEKHYSEATLTLTVVGPKNERDRYTYTSRIIVDSIPAMIMGWTLGYPKRLAKIDFSGSAFYARFGMDEPVIHVTLHNAREINSVSFKSNMNFLVKNMHQTIGKTAYGWTCYDFIWDFAHGSVEPVNAEIKFFKAFAGSDLLGRYLSPQLDKSPFGAVRIKSQWKMANFQKCK